MAGDGKCWLHRERNDGQEHMIYFVSSHSVVMIIRILSQSQDTARHEPWI
ncbi:type II toxin-antitoxin system RelE/ParE family toxin [Klebsiella pneumoniae]|nr:plasmid stabilization protein ParE [Klebsiella pneumoniae]